jgi:hypothetical protein
MTQNDWWEHNTLNSTSDIAKPSSKNAIFKKVFHSPRYYPRYYLRYYNFFPAPEPTIKSPNTPNMASANCDSDIPSLSALAVSCRNNGQRYRDGLLQLATFLARIGHR